jgi:hypothetical protein
VAQQKVVWLPDGLDLPVPGTDRDLGQVPVNGRGVIVPGVQPFCCSGPIVRGLKFTTADDSRILDVSGPSGGGGVRASWGVCGAGVCASTLADGAGVARARASW